MGPFSTFQNVEIVNTQILIQHFGNVKNGFQIEENRFSYV